MSPQRAASSVEGAVVQTLVHLVQLDSVNEGVRFSKGPQAMDIGVVLPVCHLAGMLLDALHE